LSKLPTIIFSNFFIDSSQIFSDAFKNGNIIEKYIELISAGPELGIHSLYYATEPNMFQSAGLNRYYDKFKYKIAIPGSGNFLKIFGEAGDDVRMSKSKYICRSVCVQFLEKYYFQTLNAKNLRSN
jgi:hypothetical protein